MRLSIQFLLFTAANLIIFLLLPLHARYVQKRPGSDANLQIAELRSLHVTDLCLATEARYTRHPSMADRHAPFQEHPLALEHFPSGSLILPVIPKGDKP
jgi:hypothetical protein